MIGVAGRSTLRFDRLTFKALTVWAGIALVGLWLTHLLRAVSKMHDWFALPTGPLLGRAVVSIAAISTLLCGMAVLLTLSVYGSAVTPMYAGIFHKLPTGFQLLNQSVALMSITMIWVALYFGLMSQRRRYSAELRQAQLNEALQAAELRLLKFQLDPHFLFNALNGVRALMRGLSTSDRHDERSHSRARSAPRSPAAPRAGRFTRRKPSGEPSARGVTDEKSAILTRTRYATSSTKKRSEVQRDQIANNLAQDRRPVASETRLYRCNVALARPIVSRTNPVSAAIAERLHDDEVRLRKTERPTDVTGKLKRCAAPNVRYPLDRSEEVHKSSQTNIGVLNFERV
ncbi:MAG: histidine kinase [Gammaproteobacteria bacterium]